MLHGATLYLTGPSDIHALLRLLVEICSATFPWLQHILSLAASEAKGFGPHEKVSPYFMNQ